MPAWTAIPASCAPIATHIPAVSRTELAAHARREESSTCYACHGGSSCENCHRKTSSKPIPQRSLGQRGKSAIKDRQACLMCHENQYVNCHSGVEMPHPSGWMGEHRGKGAASGRLHASNATRKSPTVGDAITGVRLARNHPNLTHRCIYSVGNHLVWRALV